jgi:hypothetical protein
MRGAALREMKTGVIDILDGSSYDIRRTAHELYELPFYTLKHKYMFIL